MGRMRTLKPELARLRELAELPRDTRWTFAMLLCFVDDEGRAADDPRLFKADIYPLDDVTTADVDADLSALAGTGLVCRYEAAGQRYLHIPWFRDSAVARGQRTAWGQRPQKPYASRYPPCELTHPLNGQDPLFADQSLNGSGSVGDQSATDPRRSVPQGAGSSSSPTVSASADGAPTPTQRSRLITNAYAAAEPMYNWPAVNGVVLKAVKSGKWSDQEITDALLRLAADSRPVTVDTLRTELTGFTPRTAPDRRDRPDDEYDMWRT